MKRSNLAKVACAACLLLVQCALGGSAYAQASGPTQPSTATPYALALVITEPRYPADALAAGKTAVADINGEVGINGRLGTPTVAWQGSSDEFADSLAEAMRSWRFVPAIDSKTCRPQPSQAHLQVRFEIQDGKPAASVFMGKPARTSTNDARVLARMKTQDPPSYPRKALVEGREGPVLVLMKVNRGGDVDDATILATLWPGVFDASVVTWARRATFEIVEPFSSEYDHICVQQELRFQFSNERPLLRAWDPPFERTTRQESPYERIGAPSPVRRNP